MKNAVKLFAAISSLILSYPLILIMAWAIGESFTAAINEHKRFKIRVHVIIEDKKEERREERERERQRK